MNMTGPMIPLSAMDAVVAAAVLLALLFVAAWLLSPRLRVWLERPKHRFQADVRCYDLAQSGRTALQGKNARS